MRINHRVIIHSLFIMLICGSVYSESLNATISGGKDIPLYDSPNNKIIDIIIPGTIVEVEKLDYINSKINYKDKTGWVETKGLTIEPGKFSEIEKKLILSSNIIKSGGTNFLFYEYNNKLYKYNLDNRKTPETNQILGIFEIHPSKSDKIFCFEGIITNKEEIHSYMLYNYQTKKSNLLGCFSAEKMRIIDTVFSDNSQYLTLHYQYKQDKMTKKGIIIYKTQTGECLSYADDVESFAWINNTIIMNNNIYFWFFNFDSKTIMPNISHRNELELYKISKDWIIENRINSKILNDKMYIQTKKDIICYDLISLRFEKTALRSLIFDETQRLNYYEYKNRMYLKNLATKEILYNFSGKNPVIEFLSFQKNNIIGKRNYESIITMFIYNEEGKELYRYKAIDSPDAWGADGIVAKIYEEKDMRLIAAEIPSNNEFYFIRIKE